MKTERPTSPIIFVSLEMPKYSIFLGLARQFSQWENCEENTAPDGVVDIFHKENYSECKYHNLVTIIVRGLSQYNYHQACPIPGVARTNI